jgi:hypothetical protein
MLRKLGEKLNELGNKIHAFALGTTMALLAVLLSQVGQGCALAGQ